MGAEFLGEHPARERFSVADIQHVHRAVADVGDHVDALHGSGLFRDGGEALGIDPNAHDVNVVGNFLPHEVNLLVPGEVCREGLLLVRRPRERKAGGEKDVCLGQPLVVQLHGDSRQRQEVEVVVLGFLAHKLLVAFADEIVSSVADQHVPRKQGLAVIGVDAGGEAMVGSFHVAIAMVDPDDFGGSKCFHVLLLLQ